MEQFKLVNWKRSGTIFGVGLVNDI